MGEGFIIRSVGRSSYRGDLAATASVLLGGRVRGSPPAPRGPRAEGGRAALGGEVGRRTSDSRREPGRGLGGGRRGRVQEPIELGAWSRWAPARGGSVAGWLAGRLSPSNLGRLQKC